MKKIDEGIESKPYNIIVFGKDGDEIREVIYAANSEQVILLIKRKYGNDAKFSAWNDEDAKKPR